MRHPKSNARLLTLVVLLLMSTGALAGGDKQRGDVGQGAVVQTQVREVDPPAQWSARSDPAPADARILPEPLEDRGEAEDYELF